MQTFSFILSSFPPSCSYTYRKIQGVYECSAHVTNSLPLETFLIGLDLHVSYDWGATVRNVHDSQVPIHNFVHVSSITINLWPFDVYQACSTQIKSGRTICGCGTCVDVSRKWMW